jgi:hypothetical protein
VLPLLRRMTFRPSRKPGVRETGWQGIAAAFSEAAHRYLDQVTVSLRPSTTKSIERDLLEETSTRRNKSIEAVAACGDLETLILQSCCDSQPRRRRCRTIFAVDTFQRMLNPPIGGGATRRKAGWQV